MKKIFSFSHPKKQRTRVAEAIKYELRKYIKRERNKKLPEDVDFWDLIAVLAQPKLLVTQSMSRKLIK